MIASHSLQTDSTVPAADVKESVWTIDASTNKTISQLNPSDCIGIIMAGGKLTINSGGQTAPGFRLSGYGTVILKGKLTAGNNSVIDLSRISLQMSGSNAELFLSAGCFVTLRDYPVKGGKLTCADVSSATVPPALSAPPCFIFDGTELTGIFSCKKTYPEWFVSNPTTQTDWSDAINNALKVAGNSVTRLQGRVYKVSNTIFMPCGSQLIGTTSGRVKDSSWKKKI